MSFPDPIRREVQLASMHRCCMCYQLCIEVHHIHPSKEDGSDDINNAAPLCPNHHTWLGNNPDHRKMIRMRRDEWYKIVKEDPGKAVAMATAAELLRGDKIPPETARALVDIHAKAVVTYRLFALVLRLYGDNGGNEYEAANNAWYEYKQLVEERSFLLPTIVFTACDKFVDISQEARRLTIVTMSELGSFNRQKDERLYIRYTKAFKEQQDFEPTLTSSYNNLHEIMRQVMGVS